MAMEGIAPNAGQAFEALVERLYGGHIPLLVSKQVWDSVLQGHTAVPLAKLELEDREATCHAIAMSPHGMLQVEGDFLYLARFRAIEDRIANKLLELSAFEPQDSTVPLVTSLEYLNPLPNFQQRRAIERAMLSRLLLLTGGPGTGKSFTLRAIVKALRQQSPDLRIAALAPTASAAQRLAQVGADFVGTVHKALGIAPGSAQLKSVASLGLPYDVVIVDEATMLSAQLADTLLNALSPHCRVVLAGDRYQLASVEAGAIFSQACSLTTALVELHQNHRFANFPLLAQFSELVVQAGTSAAQILESAAAFRRPNYGPSDIVEEAVQGYMPLLKQAQELDLEINSEQMVSAMRAFRLIVATNEGPLGLDQLSARVEERLRTCAGASRHALWYVGRLIVVLRNDAASGLRNGQTGVCVRRDGQLHVLFEQGQCLAIARLPVHRIAWATTVHKAQGDEYENVLFVLPQATSPLALRELLYTAATRARGQLGLVGDDAALLACSSQFAQRDGGLRWRLTKSLPQ
jgi:exodeoxyribonuclease V alpha subunit